MPLVCSRPESLGFSAKKNGAALRFWVPGPLPGLNEIIDAKARSYRVRRGGRVRLVNRYGEMKRMWGERVRLLASPWSRECLAACDAYGAARVHVLAVERDRRRDPDNVAAGAWKLLLDGMQGVVLRGDGWRDIRPSVYTDLAIGSDVGVLATVRWGEEAGRHGQGISSEGVCDAKARAT